MLTIGYLTHLLQKLKKKKVCSERSKELQVGEKYFIAQAVTSCQGSGFCLSVTEFCSSVLQGKSVNLFTSWSFVFGSAHLVKKGLKIYKLPLKSVVVLVKHASDVWCKDFQKSIPGVCGIFHRRMKIAFKFSAYSGFKYSRCKMGMLQLFNRFFFKVMVLHHWIL